MEVLHQRQRQRQRQPHHHHHHRHQHNENLADQTTDGNDRIGRMPASSLPLDHRSNGTSRANIGGGNDGSKAMKDAATIPSKARSGGTHPRRRKKTRSGWSLDGFYRVVGSASGSASGNGDEGKIMRRNRYLPIWGTNRMMRAKPTLFAVPFRTIPMRLLLLLFIALACSSTSFRPGAWMDATAEPQGHNQLGFQSQQLHSPSDKPKTIHIVHTRFMQEQGRLKTLGMARLLLFQSICLGTIVQQQQQHMRNQMDDNTASPDDDEPLFFWIIATDPNLDAEVRQNLVSLLQAHPNFLVLATNDDLSITSPNSKFHETSEQRTSRGSLRSFKLGIQKLTGLLQSDASRWTGNPAHLLESLNFLSQGIAQRERQQKQQQGQGQTLHNTGNADTAPALFVETRLDADDGLHPGYLNHIRSAAIADMFGDVETNPTVHGTTKGQQQQQQQRGATQLHGNARVASRRHWMVYCVKRHLEWHPQPMAELMSSTPGVLIPIEHSHLCVTPGLTVAFAIEASSTSQDVSFPLYSHDQIYNQIGKSAECLRNGTESGQHGRSQAEPSDVQQQSLRQARHLTPAEAALSSSSSPPCITMVLDPFLFSAVRSRTMTSAGMMDVDRAASAGRKQQLMFWKVMLDQFLSHNDGAASHSQGATEPHPFHFLTQSRKYIQDHSVQIAYENWLGQCTAGHSCKTTAVDALESIFQTGSGSEDSTRVEHRYPDLEAARHQRLRDANNST